MQSPTVSREGEHWNFTWEEVNLCIEIEFIREDDTGFYVEMHVQSTLHTYQDHVYRGRVNLTDPDRKMKLAAVLSGKRELRGVNWPEVLETLAERVLLDYRWGDKTVRLDEFPMPTKPSHLIQPLLPFGEPTVLFAAGGSGKSLLALGIATSVATNTRLPCGMTPLQQVNTMYLDWETSPQEQKYRMMGISVGLNIDPPPIYYRSLYRPLAGEIKRLRQEVDHYRIGLVIIDSLAAACGANPNDPVPTIAFFNALRSLGDDVTKLIIAHISKEGAQLEGGRGTPYGNAFIENMARSVWELRRSESEDDTLSLGVFHRKVNRGSLAPPIGVRITIDEDTGATSFRRFALEDDPTLAPYAPLSFRIRGALKAGGKTSHTLAELLGAKEQSVAGCLRRMHGVVRLPQGFWGLEAHG